jgi:alpha-tubulin suppressor-like RCC1 family protein
MAFSFGFWGIGSSVQIKEEITMPVNNTGFISTNVDLKSILIPKDMFAEGGLWNWGRSSVGELGTNDITSRSSPIQTVSGGTNWKQVSGGQYHTAAIKTDGTLWMWGGNDGGLIGAPGAGQLGTNDIINRSSPIQTVSGGTNWKQVSCSLHTTAIKTDGTLWMWGDNSFGELGTNDVNSRSSPVQTVSGGTNWKQVSCGQSITGAIKTDGTLWGWGRNLFGQLGTNDTTDRSSPIQTVSGGTNWKQVSAGQNASAAIKTDGTLWMWGYNFNGELGTNDRINRSSPIQTVSGGTNWKQVAVGFDSDHTAAIKTDGTLWSWGVNSSGQLGTNDRNRRSSPIQTVSGGTNWKQVSCSLHTAAIKTDGTLWMWGDNSFGQLGTNDIINRSSPIQTVSAGANWKQVSTGWLHTVACKDDN